MISQLPKLTLFYDGSCPLCQAEILFLSGRNQAKLLEFVDVHSSEYRPELIGLSCEKALASMYGQFSDGTLINGVPVFSAAYSRANLPFLAWLFSRKLLMPILNGGYYLFAKNRHAISKWFGPPALWMAHTFSNARGRK
ncbi:Predicted thiol-disulfide oxidoreductase YuxK, DCC family [Polynucleobacter meluiroseus]|jgi:predicted DCC family thiol-disulfide oxidoreductase YuxK|uniref:Predicted thiol-disulfide oxidoreductase YuxK, DCC family n=1 Tax=Polynucleobacter meluiroseus TaxID=1938814 RepID=A0A240DZK2_9BURK|nr:DUF393 domain-containing protein [Polynucleobacter meluiroseus]SNX28104.1 Predicted thiol-disulfide oxidoreductase YuxK, DCC family [Polynucleobacter meluiroseus]